jgi:Ca2+-binding RTX toxin-like protein
LRRGRSASARLIGAAGQNRERATVLFTPGSWQPDFNVYGTNDADTIGAGYGGNHKVGDLADEIYGLAGVDSIHAGDGADLLDGGSGADLLYGEGGDDIYVVDVAGDQTLEDLAGGTDTVRAYLNWTIGANIENLELMGSAHNGTGNGLDNQITGTSGNDNLDGGLGADRLIGGAGNDTYFVDQTGDIAVEAGPGGYDTVIASVDYTLGDNVDVLRLAGGAHVGTGNALANSLYGGTGDDILDGAGGADIDEFSDRGVARKNDAAVHIGGVVFAAGDTGLFDQDAQGFSPLGLRQFRGDTLLQLHGFAIAAVFDFVGKLAFHLRGAGTFFL